MWTLRQSQKLYFSLIVVVNPLLPYQANVVVGKDQPPDLAALFPTATTAAAASDSASALTNAATSTTSGASASSNAAGSNAPKAGAAAAGKGKSGSQKKTVAAVPKGPPGDDVATCTTWILDMLTEHMKVSLLTSNRPLYHPSLFLRSFYSLPTPTIPFLILIARILDMLAVHMKVAIWLSVLYVRFPINLFPHCPTPSAPCACPPCPFVPHGCFNHPHSSGICVPHHQLQKCSGDSATADQSSGASKANEELALNLQHTLVRIIFNDTFHFMPLC
ncbi:unnamed protein product [Closterium sp. NIES-53]